MSLEEQGWQRIGPVDAFGMGCIAPGKMLDQYGREVELAVTRTRHGLDVIVDRCPHQGVALTAHGCLNKRDQLVCKLHDWTFNLPNGTAGDARGVNLHTVEYQVHEDVLWVRPDPNTFY